MPFHPVLEAFEGSLEIVGHGPRTENQHAPHFPDDQAHGSNDKIKTLSEPKPTLSDTNM